MRLSSRFRDPAAARKVTGGTLERVVGKRVPVFRPDAARPASGALQRAPMNASAPHDRAFPRRVHVLDWGGSRPAVPFRTNGFSSATCADPRPSPTRAPAPPPTCGHGYDAARRSRMSSSRLAGHTPLSISRLLRWRWVRGLMLLRRAFGGRDQRPPPPPRCGADQCTHALAPIRSRCALSPNRTSTARARCRWSPAPFANSPGLSGRRGGIARHHVEGWRVSDLAGRDRRLSEGAASN